MPRFAIERRFAPHRGVEHRVHDALGAGHLARAGPALQEVQGEPLERRDQLYWFALDFGGGCDERALDAELARF
jgi:hypothetical protein